MGMRTYGAAGLVQQEPIDIDERESEGPGDVVAPPHRDDDMAIGQMPYQNNPQGAAQLTAGPSTPPLSKRGPNAAPPMNAKPAAPGTPPQASGYRGMSEQDIQGYRERMRQQFPDMPEQEFEQHVQYGIAKQRGRIAAQNKKLLAAPLGKYFSFLQKEMSARQMVESTNEKYKSKKFEADAIEDPEARIQMWMPYQDRINAAIKKAEGVTQRRKQIQQVLEGMGVKPEYLENPVTVMEFMRQLAAGDPGQAAEIPDDDFDDEDYGMQGLGDPYSGGAAR